MATYNTRERPRTVVVGVEDAAPRLLAAVEKLAGWSDARPLHVQPLDERDAVVVWQAGMENSLSGNDLGHLRVLQFGGRPITQWRINQSLGIVYPSLSYALGDELVIADACPTYLRDLVKTTLIPLLAQRHSSRRVISAGWGTDQGAEFVPLLKLVSGTTLAAIYSHPKISEVWWLPVEPDDELSFDFESWITAAFNAWRDADPERFPGAPDWTRSREWMTARELQLQDAVDVAESEREQTYAQLNARVEACTEALAAAQIEHDNAERVLGARSSGTPTSISKSGWLPQDGTFELELVRCV
jgi:hypothetical protein